MKRLMLGLTGLTVLSLTAVAADGVTTTWFDETFEKYKVSSTGDTVLKTGAGRWTRKADDRSVISTDARKLSCNTRGTELVFKPCTPDSDGYASTTEKKSPDNALARIEVSGAVFTAYRGGEEWDFVFEGGHVTAKNLTGWLNGERHDGKLTGRHRLRNGANRLVVLLSAIDANMYQTVLSVRSAKDASPAAFVEVRGK